FTGAGGKPAKSGERDIVAVRFHVHPDIAIEEDKQEWFILQGAGTDSWTFAVSGVEPIVEESIFFAGLSGPRKTKQIVLSFNPTQFPELRWQFRRTSVAGNGAV